MTETANSDGVRLLALAEDQFDILSRDYRGYLPDADWGRDQANTKTRLALIEDAERKFRAAIDALRAAPVPHAEPVPEAAVEKAAAALWDFFCSGIRQTESDLAWYRQAARIVLYAAPARCDAEVCLGDNAPCDHFKCTGNQCLDCVEAAKRYDAPDLNALANEIWAKPTFEKIYAVLKSVAAPSRLDAGSDYVLMPREATRAMTMAGCDSLPSCEHVFGHAGEMLRNAYRKMVEVAALSPSSNGGEEDLVQRTASDASPPRSHPGNGD